MDSFGSPTATSVYSLSATIHTDPDSFGTPAVTPGAVTLSATLFADSDGFGTHVITLAGGTQSLTASLYTDTDAFGVPVVTSRYTILPAHYAEPDSFGTPTVTASYTLTAALYSAVNTFGTPVVTTTVNIQPSLYVEPDDFGTHTVTLPGGTQTLTGVLYVDTDLFGSATVSIQPVFIPAAQMRIWAARGGVTVNGDKVLGPQQPFIANIVDNTGGTPINIVNDTTADVKDDIATIATKINEVLAMLKAHGLIAS